MDQQGRFSNDIKQEDLIVLEADTIILAIGQAIDLDSLGDHGPEISPRPTIAVDPDPAQLDAVRAASNVGRSLALIVCSLRMPPPTTCDCQPQDVSLPSSTIFRKPSRPPMRWASCRARASSG